MRSTLPETNALNRPQLFSISSFALTADVANQRGSAVQEKAAECSEADSKIRLLSIVGLHFMQAYGLEGEHTINDRACTLDPMLLLDVLGFGIGKASLVTIARKVPHMLTISSGWRQSFRALET